MNLGIPEVTEAAACPVCEKDQGQVVAERGRFGMAVRNVCCQTCGTVYVTPRPSAAAMAEYYESTYREHYGGVGYLTPNGERVVPGQAGFDEAKQAWHEQQATNAMAASDMSPGDRVLEVGCRHGLTLAIQRDRLGIEAYGIEPGKAEAQLAIDAGIDCFIGGFEDYEPPKGLLFDKIQLFHVLEHLHEPLEALVRFRSFLKPGGMLILEVPNVYQPYGSLKDNFFQNVHLVSYSPNTLPALLRRAGFDVTGVHDGGALFCVARRRETEQTLPLAFAPAMLAEPEQTADWVMMRLKSYENVEALTEMFRQSPDNPQLLSLFIKSLCWPVFPGALIECCAEWVETLNSKGRIADTLGILDAVILGPHPKDVREEFQTFAERLRGEGGDALSSLLDEDTSSAAQ